MDIESIEQAFVEQVVTGNALWTIQDEKGIPTPKNSENIAAMPFWSTESLAKAFIQKAEGYQAFQLLKVEWSAFSDKWAYGIHKDGLCIGLNWQADSAENVDVEVAEIVEKIKAQIDK